MFQTTEGHVLIIKFMISFYHIDSHVHLNLMKQ
jgi:hypothetical protein